jgi:seryl-tRNA synthetase
MILEHMKVAARILRRQIQEKKRELEKVEDDIAELQAKIPNMTHPDVPVGKRGRSTRLEG